MTRIFITGNAGSGKTTLARRVGEQLGLTVFGLDEIVWRPGWRKSPADWRAEKIAALIAPEAWVIEGVSATVLEAADFVIFLDVDRRTSFFRCARRNWRYLFRSRPGLPENCPEILIIPKLIQIIWNFPSRVRPGILAALAGRADSSWIVRRPGDLQAALSALSVEQPDSHRAKMCPCDVSLSIP
jgi:adenylate kinase family enzyme